MRLARTSPAAATSVVIHVERLMIPESVLAANAGVMADALRIELARLLAEPAVVSRIATLRSVARLHGGVVEPAAGPAGVGRQIARSVAKSLGVGDARDPAASGASTRRVR